jgi:hypothetical protein
VVGDGRYDFGVGALESQVPSMGTSDTCARLRTAASHIETGCDPNEFGDVSSESQR